MLHGACEAGGLFDVVVAHVEKCECARLQPKEARIASSSVICRQALGLLLVWLLQ